MNSSVEPPFINVVAGIVLNQEGDYLLSSRPASKPYAGYWEFAGGKVEAGESDLAALKREFEEELGIEIHHATPWLSKLYHYEHATVSLRFFRVQSEDWSGELQAREGQNWSWQKAGDFDVSPMLPANGSILTALAVPCELSGNLNTGFRGENRMGEYRVVPFAQAEPHHQRVLITESQLRARGKQPKADSVWVAIETPEQFDRVPDADVVVAAVHSESMAEWVVQRLVQGVSQPLVVLADEPFFSQYRNQWQQAGAQAVVWNNEIEAV